MFTVIIPCYNTPKMVAYSLAQILKNSKEGDVDVVLINNYPKDQETKKYVNRICSIYPNSGSYVKLIDYPENLLQSHGIAVDWAIKNKFVLNNYFMVLESDSFPENDLWIEYYNKIIEEQYDAAYSILKLSGGLYGHPCGALYSVKAWNECNKAIEQIQYSYFPNFNKRQGFDYHLMIHNSVFDKVMDSPEDFFDLAESYKPYTKQNALLKMEHYKPTTGVFHNGMGNFDEEVLNYGTRGFDSGVIDVKFDNKRKIIRRVGLEPGQFFSYWLHANDKKICSIPTEVKWMNNRIGQQQEYTLTESGIKHLWGISSYTERPADGVEDIYKEKREMPEKLYNTLPENQKL